MDLNYLLMHRTHAGREPEAADVAPSPPDPDDAADGAVAAGRVRLLPPPPHAELALGHPPQGVAGSAAASRATPSLDARA
jgi:hypothetical protein